VDFISSISPSGIIREPTHGQAARGDLPAPAKDRRKILSEQGAGRETASRGE